MAILALTSDLYATPPVMPDAAPNRAHAVLRALRWQLPATLVVGDAGTTIQIATLPQRGRYCSQLSKMGWKGFGVGRTLDLGWLTYTRPDGTQAPANATGLATGLDVAADGRTFIDAFPLGSTDEWEAVVPVTLVLTVRGGTIPIGTTMGGLVVYLSAY
jgi:hypothetical protein